VGKVTFIEELNMKVLKIFAGPCYLLEDFNIFLSELSDCKRMKIFILVLNSD
jgi:hypothetical protein